MSADIQAAAAFKAKRQHSQIKRAMNRNWSSKELSNRGVPFVSKNGGAHLIVDGHINFWPGTGRWGDLNTPNGGRGITSLLNFLQVAA